MEGYRRVRLPASPPTAAGEVGMSGSGAPYVLEFHNGLQVVQLQPAGGTPMTTNTPQDVTGVKQFAPGTLLMENAAGTVTAEPYSDLNPPQTLNLTEYPEASVPTPPAGQATLFTDAGATLKLKNDGGAVVTIGPQAGGGGSSEAPIAQVQVDLGGAARRGRFTISDPLILAGHQLIVQMAASALTGKGTRADECEMDHVDVRGEVTAAGTALVYWSSSTFVKGNFRFNYRSS